MWGGEALALYRMADVTCVLPHHTLVRLFLGRN
jgi:hypothetical protein